VLRCLLVLVACGYIQQPEDGATAAVWLTPDTFNCAIGTTLFIDGGMTLYPGFHENG
jgi:glucose 1-dehydrogenase